MLYTITIGHIPLYVYPYIIFVWFYAHSNNHKAQTNVHQTQDNWPNSFTSSEGLFILLNWNWAFGGWRCSLGSSEFIFNAALLFNAVKHDLGMLCLCSVSIFELYSKVSIGFNFEKVKCLGTYLIAYSKLYRAQNMTWNALHKSSVVK